MFELTVTVKDSESSYKRKFLMYSSCMVSQDDVYIKECIDQTLADFGKEPDSVKLRINIEC